MLRVINSDLIENNYLRIILLVIIICFLTYLQYHKHTKKIRGGIGISVKGPKYKNYIGYFIIYFVIPKFFDIDQSGILSLINIIGFATTFLTSLFVGAHIWFFNLILITISVFI